MDAARQKRAAKKFVECWAFRGVPDAPQTAKTTKFLDAWIPATRTLVEHKSRGVDLDAPQAGHDGKTPLEQAEEEAHRLAFLADRAEEMRELISKAAWRIKRRKNW